MQNVHALPGPMPGHQKLIVICFTGAVCLADLNGIRHKKMLPKMIWKHFINLARLAGFEPTTPWFVAKYSIQLSYSRCEESDYKRYLRLLQQFFFIPAH